ncbi:MAG: hypothetical protein NTZ32_09230 [Planctomycetales bacterium]|nr:hypothetical protein [Planctomycetales bacterium]
MTATRVAFKPATFIAVLWRPINDAVSAAVDVRAFVGTMPSAKPPSLQVLLCRWLK